MTTNNLTGSLNDYYLVRVDNPQRVDSEPYTAECEDIIHALGLNFDEGNVFKAIWRNAKSRKQEGKKGSTNIYEAEKIHHYGKRILLDAIYKEPISATQYVLLGKHFPERLKEEVE